MRDIHCHILPGVDDGARNLAESLAMLEVAKLAGIDAITCTPHVRDPYFDSDSYEKMWDAFEVLEPHAQERGIQIQMAFEVNFTKFSHMKWDWVPLLAFDKNTAPVIDGHRVYNNEFLLELPVEATAQDFDREISRLIFRLQNNNYQVIIAHPERCVAIQRNITIANRLISEGCLLQASADYIYGGRLGKEKATGDALMKEGLYHCVASDAHKPKHYDAYMQALKEYKRNKRNDRLM